MNTVPAEGTAPRPEGEQPLNAAEAPCPALGTQVLTLCLIELLNHLPPAPVPLQDACKPLENGDSQEWLISYSPIFQRLRKERREIDHHSQALKAGVKF